MALVRPDGPEPRHSWERVGAEEQVAKGSAPQVGEPPPPQMLRPVVQQVAALAPCGQIPVAVQAGVVRPMAGRQDRQRQPGLGQGREPGRAPKRPTPAGAPLPGLGIVPRSLVQADDHLPVRPPAGLAAPAGPAEADRVRELRPVDRVEVAVFGADRHDAATLARPR